MKSFFYIIVGIIVLSISSCFLFASGASGIEIYNDFEFTGNGDHYIDQLYCRVPSSTDWGVSYIDYDSGVGAGTNRTIEGLPVGTYDLIAVTTEGFVYIKESIELKDSVYGDIYIWTIP